MQQDIDSEVLIPDAARTIEGLRDTGYSFNTAVADVVDNSIAAGASRIDVSVGQLPGAQVQIVVADNGKGMDIPTLRDAMRLGSPPRHDPYSLGKFGLGLKTASFSMARQLDVVTRTAEDLVPIGARWDLAFVQETNEWRVQYPEPSDFDIGLIDAVSPNAAGTAVIWRKVDRLFDREYQNPGGGWAKRAFDAVEKELRWHLALTYSRYLSRDDEKKITISVNDLPLKAWDPFGTGLPGLEKLLEMPFDVQIDGRTAEMTVKAYLLPHKSTLTEEQQTIENITNDLQGFYVFRHDRLLAYGTWLGLFSLEPHYSYLRVDLSFDHQLDDALKLDIKKSRIEFRHEIANELRQRLAAPRAQARLHYDQKQRNKITALSGNAHERSNRALSKDGLSGAQTTQQDASHVLVENQQGKVVIVVKTTEEEERPIVPVASLDDGVLWETAYSHNQRSIRVNTGHPFYQRAYYPLSDFPLAHQALDFFLWALVSAQLEAVSEREQEHMDGVRQVVSRILRKLALSDLPEPDVEDAAAPEDDAAGPAARSAGS